MKRQPRRRGDRFEYGQWAKQPPDTAETSTARSDLFALRRRLLKEREAGMSVTPLLGENVSPNPETLTLIWLTCECNLAFFSSREKGQGLRRGRESTSRGRKFKRWKMARASPARKFDRWARRVTPKIGPVLVSFAKAKRET